MTKAKRRRILLSNLEKARAARAAKRNHQPIEFPGDIQLRRYHDEQGTTWVAQGEIKIHEGGHFLVQGYGSTPSEATADMETSFSMLPFAKS